MGSTRDKDSARAGGISSPRKRHQEIGRSGVEGFIAAGESRLLKGGCGTVDALLSQDHAVGGGSVSSRQRDEAAEEEERDPSSFFSAACHNKAWRLGCENDATWLRDAVSGRENCPTKESNEVNHSLLTANKDLSRLARRVRGRSRRE